MRFDKDPVSGNARLLQEDTYYPFGLTSSYVWVGPKNLYLQNDKELQEDGFGGVALALYDYAARMYDATIGRFVGMDPLADQDPTYSPYAFCGHNPANFFDPDGLKWKKWNWKKIIKIAAIVVTAVAVVAIIAAVPVIVCPGTALAGFVGGGTGATTLGSLAAGMISSAAGAIGGAIVAAGGAIAAVLPQIATALTGAFIKYKKVEMSKPVSNPQPPLPDPTTPTSPDCNCDDSAGDLYVLFNGKTLQIMQDGKSVYSVPAYSGKPLDGYFDYSITNQQKQLGLYPPEYIVLILNRLNICLGLTL